MDVTLIFPSAKVKSPLRNLMTLREQIGDLLRRRRTSRGVTLVELSEETGHAPGTISQIETGKANSTIDTIERLYAGLGDTLEVGAGGTNEDSAFIRRLTQTGLRIPREQREVVLHMLAGMIEGWEKLQEKSA